MNIEEIRKGAPTMKRNKDYLLVLIKSAANTIGFQVGKFDETILKDIQSYINEYQLL